MKVLEHGWIYNEKHYILECNCGCKYKYNEEDIKEVPRLFLGYNLKDRYYLCYYVECPECREKYWLSKMIPISREEYERRRESE